MRSMIWISLVLTGSFACRDPSPDYQGIERQPKNASDELVSFGGPPGEERSEDDPSGEARGSVRTPAAIAEGGPEARAARALGAEGQAEAVIGPAPSVASFAGAAELRESAEGVHMVIALDRAPQGQHEVAMASSRACVEILSDKKADAAGTPRGEPLGVIDVDRDGEALFKGTLPATNLKEGRGSVLGKSIVIREQPKPPERAAGNVLGCGVITRAEGKNAPAD